MTREREKTTSACQRINHFGNHRCGLRLQGFESRPASLIPILHRNNCTKIKIYSGVPRYGQYWSSFLLHRSHLLSFPRMIDIEFYPLFVCPREIKASRIKARIFWHRYKKWNGMQTRAIGKWGPNCKKIASQYSAWNGIRALTVVVFSQEKMQKEMAAQEEKEKTPILAVWFCCRIATATVACMFVRS